MARKQPLHQPPGFWLQSSSTHTSFPQSVRGRRYLIYLIRGKTQAISQPFSTPNKVRSVCSRDQRSAGAWGELCLNEEVGRTTSSATDARFCCTQHEAAKSSRCQSSEYKQHFASCLEDFFYVFLSNKPGTNQIVNPGACLLDFYLFIYSLFLKKNLPLVLPTVWFDGRDSLNKFSPSDLDMVGGTQKNFCSNCPIRVYQLWEAGAAVSSRYKTNSSKSWGKMNENAA